MATSRPKKRARLSLRLWARGRLDIGGRDLLFALGAPLLPGMSRRIWPTKTTHIATLSVRTAWDALLCIQNWPPRSEIILSEANIPDMVRLIELHGLVPITVPLNVDTLEVEASDVTAAVTERTRAILVSPLFGSRMDLEEIAVIARRHNLLLVEDNAQGFSDTGFQGSPVADVTLFSFGLIKTRTALGGAVVFARDPKLLRAIERQTGSYQRVSISEFYKKLVKATALQCLSHSLLFGLLWRVLERRGLNPDLWLSQITRGMNGADLLCSIRRQPHRATLKLLRRRLSQKDDARTNERGQRGKLALRELPCALGSKARRPFFWALPVAVDNRETLIENARREGFDLTFRASSVTCHGQKDTAFSRALERAVFLPIGTPIPETQWKRLLQIVRDFCESEEKKHEERC